jgi:hypothetical protein
MGHDHDHAHGHDHHHGDERTEYYLEQLFTIGACGALAAVALTLWFRGNRGIGLMLTEWLWPTILASGLTLLALVVIRAVVVWRSVEDPSLAGGHLHAHGDSCGHTHGPGCDHGHEHKPEHAHASPEGVQPAGQGLPVVSSPTPQAHDHDHGHHHHHGHGHGHDHDHGWAPWRFVVLLLPVALFFLNLPNSGFKNFTSAVNASQLDRSADRASSWSLAVTSAAGALAGPLNGGPLAALVGLAPGHPTGEGEVPELAIGPHWLDQVGSNSHYPVTFFQLEGFARSERDREIWTNRMVSVSGQYAGTDDKSFTLIRYKMACCMADAIPLKAVILVDYALVPNSKDRLDPNQYQNKWVRVTGRVQFLPQRGGGGYITALIVRPRPDRPLSELIKIVDRGDPTLDGN